jgi:hypothetical protein
MPSDTAFGRVQDRQEAFAADLAAHREVDARAHGEIMARLDAVDAKLAALARAAERRSDRQWQLWVAVAAAVLSGLVGAVAALHR